MIEVVEDEFLKIQRKKDRIKHNKIKEFYLPSHNFSQQIYRTLTEFEDSLHAQDSQKCFKKIKRKQYVYYCCKYCHARITAIIENSQIRLTKFFNFHVHKKNQNKKLEEKMVLKLLQQSESNNHLESPQQSKKRITQLLCISKSRYDYIVRKYVDTNCYQKAIRYLDDNFYHVKVKHFEQQQLPQLMLIMSQQQKRLAFKFNDTFSFDITYNILKNRSKDQKQWGVGVFNTFDTNLRILPVAFCIILRQNKNAFASLFQGFLQLIQNNTCTFITDQQIAIKSGINVLAEKQIFHGNHVMDDFHLLRNIKKKAMQDQFTLLHSLITTKYPNKFEKIVNIYKQKQYNQYLLQQILDNKQKYCFSQGKQKFVGLRFSSSSTQKCHDLMKKIIPRQTNIFRLILSFNRLQRKVNSYTAKFEKRKFQEIFNDARIKEVRELVQQKIFRVFLQNYIKGLRAKIQESRISKQEYKVDDIQTTGHSCQCAFTVRCGIPCYHMMAILSRETDLQYTKYFNPRWIQKKDCALKKTGSRRSRRR